MDESARSAIAAFLKSVLGDRIVFAVIGRCVMRLEIEPAGIGSGLWLVNDGALEAPLSADAAFPGVAYTEHVFPHQPYVSGGIGFAEPKTDFVRHPIMRAARCTMFEGPMKSFQLDARPLLELITGGDLYDLIHENLQAREQSEVVKEAYRILVSLKSHLAGANADVAVLPYKHRPQARPRQLDDPWQQKLADVADVCAGNDCWYLVSRSLAIELVRSGKEFTVSRFTVLGKSRALNDFAWFQSSDSRFATSKIGFGWSSLDIPTDAADQVKACFGEFSLAQAKVTRQKVTPGLERFLADLPGIIEGIRKAKQSHCYGNVERRELFEILGFLAGVNRRLANNEQLLLWSPPTAD